MNDNSGRHRTKSFQNGLFSNATFYPQDTQAAAAALTSLGHVYTAIGDYPNALASHKQCVQLVKQMGDRLQEAREIGNVGAVYLAMGEFDSAVDCHTQHLRLARRLGDQVSKCDGMWDWHYN